MIVCLISNRRLIITNTVLFHSEHDNSLQIKYKTKKINKEKEPKLSVSDSSDTERSYKDYKHDKHKVSKGRTAGLH